MTNDRCRLLVVDDNEDVRRLLRLVLDDDESIEIVGEATNGREGVSAAQACRPDVIVLDVNMPVMDGLAALPHIRRAAPNAAIVVWTASLPDDGAEQRTLELGADGFIRKAGGDPLAILEFIRTACAARPARG